MNENLEKRSRAERRLNETARVLNERPDIVKLIRYAIDHKWGKAEIDAFLNSLEQVTAAE